MNRDTAPAVSDLREHLNVIRARKWTIILVTVLVSVTALALSLRQTPIYESTTKVLVEPIRGDPQANTPLLPVDLATQEQVVASQPVAVLVQEDLGTDLMPSELLEDLRVGGISDSQVLEIRYASPDATFARDVARSFAENYLAYREEQGLEDTLADRRAIQGRVSSTNDQLQEIESQVDDARKANDDDLVSNLETQRNVLIARLGVLQQRLDDLQTATVGQRSGGQVIEPADLPEAPASPNHKLNAALGLFLGLALGTGLAFLRERLDNRFRGREDIERSLNVPSLGTVPRFGNPKGTSSQRFLAAQETGSAASEAYRSLRTNLKFITSQREIRSVAITSSAAGEGKSITTANLAVVLAQDGLRVILLSTDLRRPTLSRYFGVADDDEMGLSTWLAQKAPDASAIIRDPGIPNLRLVPSGPVPPNPAELLSSTHFRQLVLSCERSADIVLLDSPPVLAVADAAILATHVGGVLLVVDPTATHRTATSQAKSDIEKAGGRLLGTVINSYDSFETTYTYGSYQMTDSYSSSGNGSGEKPRRRRIKRRDRSAS